MESFLRRFISGPVFLFAALALFLALNAIRDPRPPQLAPLGAQQEATPRPRGASPVPTATLEPLSAHTVPVSTVEPLPPLELAAVADGPIDRSTAGIDLIDETEIYTGELDLLAQELQEALDYVVERTGMRPFDRIRVVIGRDDYCGFHGVTYSLARLVQIWSCEGISRQRVVNIAAHEFVHQLAQDYYGPQHLRADLILSEGIATWGAGKYWLGGRPGLDVYAYEYRTMGYALPLSTSYEELGTIDGMNALYYQWASFVEYLISSYGRQQFDELYLSGGNRQAGGAAYERVYDADLRALQLQWERHLGLR